MKFPKYLQGYFIIFLLTIVYSLLSIFYELNYESEKRPLKEENLFQMMFLRFIHSFVVIYIYVSVFIFYRSENIHWQKMDIDRVHHAKLKNQRSAVIWMTGLSGSWVCSGLLRMRS